MNVLLDTHASLWAVLKPHNLSSKVRTLLENPDTGMVVSAASAWEIAIKYRLGRLPDAADVITDYDGAIRGSRARSLPVKHTHALAAGAFPQSHRDPFDRMLVAQADVEGLTLVSKDRGLHRFDVDIL